MDLVTPGGEESYRHPVREPLMELSQLEAVFRTSPAFMATVRGPDHVFELANPAYYRVVGNRELIGRPAREALPELVEQGFIELMDRVYATGEPYVGKETWVKLQREPGREPEQRIVNFIYMPLRDDEGTVTGILRQGIDVTETVLARRQVEEQAKQLEAQLEELQNQAAQLEENQAELEMANADLQSMNEKLEESEVSFRSLFDSLTELISILDLEGRFVNVNEAVLARFGYSREEVIGRSAELLTEASGGETSGFQDAFRRALSGERQRLEMWGRTRDGETFPREVTLTPGRYFGQDVVIMVGRDITDRKEAEMAVSRSRDFYTSIFDRFPALIWRTDATGACDYFNDAWLEFTGRSVEQELGECWAEGVHPEDQERRLRISRQSFAAREPFEMEYRLRHHTGEYRWIRDLGRPVHNLEGRFIGYIGGAFDIEGHRRMETQFRQAQKMEAVGRLAGGIAHDFNNVLLVIKGNAELALSEMPPRSPLRTDLEEIGRAADRAANLTRQLLSFSRQQVLQPVVLNLNDIISDLEKMLRRTLGEDIELVSRLDPEIGRIKADPGQVQQILMNLAVNARDAMPTGGKLITETKNFELDDRLAGSYPYDVQTGPYVMLSITDTGVGMSRSVREQIFEPFFTTKPQGEGTGLGLSTVYGIVKQSGGYIWVQSEEGEGTTFMVLFPRISESVRPAARRKHRIAAGRSATILLVEDEPAVRSTARRMLERLGHIVLEAENGAEALRIAEANDGGVDLLLTDVVMPVMGGRELAERVVARWPDVRVLYTSGYTDEAVVRHGVQEGSAAFLQKPYDRTALEEKVAALLKNGAEE